MTEFYGLNIMGEPDGKSPQDSPFSFTLQKVTDIPPFFST